MNIGWNFNICFAPFYSSLRKWFHADLAKIFKILFLKDNLASTVIAMEKLEKHIVKYNEPFLFIPTVYCVNAKKYRIYSNSFHSPFKGRADP